MVNEDKLSSVLSEFARTLITDFPIQRILDHLVERIVEVLPITSAGVTLISAGLAPHYVAASNDSALRFERLQADLSDGPCLWAYESGEAICVADLTSDHRFPQFAPGAVAAGLGAVFTFPLRHGDSRLGALDLYRESAGDLDVDDLAAAQTLADVVAAYLLNAQARDEARATSDRFHHSAMHDTLTGLPNRLLLHERLEHASQRAKRTQTNTAILFADLDNFKHVNDTFGHLVGDELLLAVAQRMSGLIRSSDTLARFSGDEFVFLYEGLTSPGDVEILAHRIYDAFAQPFELAGTQLIVSASVGMAFAGPGEEVTNELLFRADMAMYQAKRRTGGERKIIDIRDALLIMDDRSLEADLRLSLANHEFHVAYQPIVSMQTQRIEGVEALLRWTHASRGPVPPATMVPVAERTGLIGEIGTWVLEQSCRDHTSWRHGHPNTALDLSVNVSVRQLLSPAYYESVADVLERTEMDPTSLILEITESILIHHGDRVLTMLHELTALGVRLALDDFGTGYSSLSYLARLPVQVIKIDGSFVGDICTSPG